MKTYEDLIKWLHQLSPEQLDQEMKVVAMGDYSFKDDAFWWLDYAGNYQRISFDVLKPGKALYAYDEYDEGKDRFYRVLEEIDDPGEENRRELTVEEVLEGLDDERTVTEIIPSGMPYIKLEKIKESKSL